VVGAAGRRESYCAAWNYRQTGDVVGHEVVKDEIGAKQLLSNLLATAKRWKIPELELKPGVPTPPVWNPVRSWTGPETVV
jgi:hypothetical protein